MGIHHVTAIAGDPQQNLDFYTGVLGLRLVKLTVNFDDPGTYHLYYGDEMGRPGTILTFFTWPNSPKGRTGVGQSFSVALAIPESAVSYWMDRLLRLGVPFKGPTPKLGNSVLEFNDPDGMNLELVGDASMSAIAGWSGGPVPPDSAIRGVFGMTLLETAVEPTREVLTGPLAFHPDNIHETIQRFRAEGEGTGRTIDVRSVGGFWSGAMGVGSIHHVAFRAESDEEQLRLRTVLREGGAHVTQVLDREYFRSVYFHEPGGVLFEIATDAPGFMVDEPLESLGTQLKLPPWLEPERASIQGRLPPIELTGARKNHE